MKIEPGEVEFGLNHTRDSNARAAAIEFKQRSHRNRISFKNTLPHE